MALGIGDSFAAIVGKRFGKHKLFKKKSLEGCIAFVASIYCALFLISFLSFKVSGNYYFTTM